MSNHQFPYHQPENNNQGGFTVPEGYFNESRTKILARVNRGGFEVPEGYFNQNKNRLLLHINPKPKHFNIKPIWYAAAAALLVTVGLIFFMPSTQNNIPVALSDDEIINYVSTQKINDLPIEVLAIQEVNFTDDTTEEIIDGVDEETLLNEL
jgi:hypothetical protein